MSNKNPFDQYQIPLELKTILSEYGIKDFFPPQKAALEAGALKGKNLLLSVPTAAGKTLIAELCMVQAVLQSQGRCLYLAPLKAIAHEKYEDFTKKYSSLGVHIGLATSDQETDERLLSSHQILIATCEKVDSLLRARAKWLIDKVQVVVFDEIHLLNDESRGPTLEILAARIRQLNPKTQFLALSATVKNAVQIAGWLKASLVASTWRPIPLKEGVFYNQEIIFHQHPTRMVQEEAANDLSQLCSDTLRGQGQALIFVNSRKSAQAVSREISASVSRLLSAQEKLALAQISKDILGSGHESTKSCRKLADVIKLGVAFHHAGLKSSQRRLIEESYKKNLIKVICSTPTLAAGVNLPARRVIIRDVKRFESHLGSSLIPVSEYKQCAGRAGRPQFDEFGEAVLLAKTSGELKTLFDRYIKADPEPVISKLGNSSSLRFHILSSIAGGYVHDMNDTFEFLSHTFLSYQKLMPNLLDVISDVFEFLSQEGFIEKTGFRFHATPFGQCTSRLYIDPASSLVLRDGLKKIHQGKSFSAIGLLHWMTCCPDMPLIKAQPRDAEDIEQFLRQCQDELIFSQTHEPGHDNYLTFLSIGKTTSMLLRWIDESSEEEICDHFGIGPGDIYRHTESCRWLLNAAIAFCELFQHHQLSWPLANLRARIQYGIKEELLELTSLKGIGRVRARNLFKNGIKSLKDFQSKSIDDLAGIDTIGKQLAADILKQATLSQLTTSQKAPEELNRLLKNV